MKKPRSEYEFIQGVINKTITEEEYFQKRTDSENRIIIDLPEANILKTQPHIFKKFLLSFSVDGRFRILFTKDILGMPENGFKGKYGVDNKTVSGLKGKYNVRKCDPKNVIRPIRSWKTRQIDYTSSLAIASRIPVEWLIDDEFTADEWAVNHFKSVNKVILKPAPFIQYLRESNEYVVANKDNFKHTRPNFTYLYDIRPVILKHDSGEIYLRTIILEQGGFIIELFGVYNQLVDLDTIRKILEPFGALKMGYCKTVIKNHYNIQIIPKNLVDKKHYPAEFIEF